MTTSEPYAKVKGMPVTDWNEEIKSLINLQKNSVENGDKEDVEALHSKLKGLLVKSEGWVTCACGNQCASIPRFSETGAPVDKLLGALGSKFHEYLTNFDFYGARRILGEIEDRAAHLIARK